MGSSGVVGAAAAVLLVVVGCGNPEVAVPLEAPVVSLDCAGDLVEIVDLLRVGAPTYDYDPAVDLPDLADRADVVAAGSIDRLIRSDDGETVIVESSDLAQLGPDDVVGPTSGFDVEGVWALRDVADPLSEPIRVEGLEAIAFLHDRDGASGRFSPGPQGLYLGCVDSDEPATSVFEPAPPGASGLSVAELTKEAGAVFVSPVPPSVPPSSELTAGLLPLHQQNATLELGVDGAPLVELSLGFEEWNDERADPAEPEPSVGVVVTQSAEISLRGVHPADATVTLFRLDKTLRFVQDMTIEWDGTSATIPAPRTGTWFVDIRAVFGPSLDYEGSGVLRAGAWLHVTPDDAPCVTPSVTPAFSPDSNVTGVVDSDGCPIATADASLDLGALTPWFHCAPWPPVLQWRTGDDIKSKRYWQYVSDPGEIVNVTPPEDAAPTGRFIPAGQILTSPSEPNAVYVQTQDGTTQRWTAPDEELGCV